MKKVLAVSVLGLLSLSSCVKTYTCTCTTTNGTQSYTSTSTLSGKKADVKTACEGGSNTYTVCAVN